MARRKVWISANDIIKRNSEEETLIELHGNGSYLAKLTQRLHEIDAKIKAEDEARLARARKRAEARARREAIVEEELERA